MENQVHEYFMAPISLIGRGCLEKLADYLKPMKLRKALIVSDKFLVQSGLIRRLTDTLESVGLFYVIYDGVNPNPTVNNANYGLKLFKDNGCDFLISFGGGSPHDCAKAVAFLATNGGQINDYEGLNKLKQPSALMISVNTTAGTGSELTRFCVITDEERHVKMTISDWRITPRIAINDATLMVDMPPSLTAATGMDALTHAIEAYVSTNATPVTDCKALKAIELIANHLPTAVHDGKNLHAREMMINAAYLAGIAFNNASVGYVHSAAHQLGGFYNLPHGLCNAIMLPVVAEFNAKETQEKFRDISEAFGIKTMNMTLEQSAQAAIIAIRTLSKEVGIPVGLREVRGFNEKDIPLLAANALKDMCSLTNPRQATQEQMEELFRAAI
ncbi:MAG: iron-containing alcohol dehydrogenase [Sporomusaceae bacterium]|nr:iron-containing alcohol dehydrogenase [Sporomusaceae bacterium]